MPENLLKHDLTINEVVEAIRQNNQNMGDGLIERDSEELMVRSLGQIKTTEDIENIVLKSHRGSPVYVKDVALVEFGEAFRRGVVSLNGEKEVFIGGVYKLHGANSFDVIRRVRARLDEMNKTLPPGVQVSVFHDQGALVMNSINTVRNALIVGLILVCVVAFVFLGNLRNTFIMVLSLPFSVLLAIAMMYRYGIPGDLISFGGAAIALGMTIDATIIMVEKIQSPLQNPSDRHTTTEVIVSTAHEIGQPIFFALAIIIIVFLPTLILQNVEGKMFCPLAFSVTVTIIGSLIYALVIAPVFYSMLHKEGVADLQTEQFSGQTQVQIAIDREAIARHSLNCNELQRLLHDAVGGEIVGFVFEQERSFDINVRGRDVGGFVEEAQEKVAASISLPPGYVLSWGGQFELQQTANRRLMIIIPITLLLVLTMLYGLFGSVKNIVLIMLNIPLALVGGVFALWLAGENLSIPSSIGFIALFGIALTDGLLLISRFEYLGSRGFMLEEAVVQGSLSKLRPVLMTTFTTALGLLPLIITSGVGSEIQQPLAIVVVGGLTSSTLLTLVVLPVLYVLVHKDNQT
ncbi:MAG: efflux RND transporter permease subunit [Sedimentisphaerales bacterium]|nr:efflux RND transporter permease subunit [Sedimentisphaerales bacterium]